MYLLVTEQTRHIRCKTPDFTLRKTNNGTRREIEVSYTMDRQQGNTNQHRQSKTAFISSVDQFQSFLSLSFTLTSPLKRIFLPKPLRQLDWGGIKQHLVQKRQSAGHLVQAASGSQYTESINKGAFSYKLLRIEQGSVVLSELALSIWRNVLIGHQCKNWHPRKGCLSNRNCTFMSSDIQIGDLTSYSQLVIVNALHYNQTFDLAYWSTSTWFCLCPLLFKPRR